MLAWLTSWQMLGVDASAAIACAEWQASAEVAADVCAVCLDICADQFGAQVTATGH